MTETTRDWYLRAARELAETSARQVSWCLGIADDPRIRELLEQLPRPARQPSLLFAVAGYLGAPDADYRVWAQWLLEHRDALLAELPVRRVQTNEPNRCVPLLVALARIPGPIALIELGASAGLCLLPDHYGYLFRSEGAPVALGAGAPVLEAELDAPLLPRALPDIRWRQGVDLAPLDAADADDVRWLEASLPPDRPERLERLRHAVTTARAVAPEPTPRVIAGDAFASLAGLATAAPSEATLVVASLGTAVYLPPTDRTRLLGGIRALGARAVTFEPRAALPEVAERWDALAAEGRVDPAARFVLALDGEPLASGAAHSTRLAAVTASTLPSRVRPAGRADPAGPGS